MRHSTLLVVIFSLAGCSTLFPEFDGTPASTDMALSTAADSGTLEITGQLCLLGDVRDPRTCVAGNTIGMHVDVEETRDSAPVDATGSFTLPLSQALSVATLAAADPSGTYTATISKINLSGGRAIGVAVPIMQAQTVTNAALGVGVALDPSRGTVFAWAVDTSGNAESGAVAQLAGAQGPFYDGAQVGQVQASASTGARGLVAFYNATPGTDTVTVTSSLGSIPFPLPVRAGAVTFSLLIP